MGILSWIGASVLTSLLLRLIPLGRVSWRRELLFAAVAGVAAGFVATALDFGGLAEFEWRAAAFSAIAAAGAVGMVRLSGPRPGGVQSRPSSGDL